MKILTKISLSLLFMSFQVPCLASNEISDGILQNEVKLTGPQSIDQQSILVVVDLKGRYRRLSREFLTALTRSKVSTAGYKTVSYSGDYSADFEKGEIPVPLLLTPKLVIEIDSGSIKEVNGVALKCSLSFIDYYSSNESEDHYIPRAAWVRNRDFKGDSTDELEALAIQYIQKEIGLLQSQILKKTTPAKIARQRRARVQHDAGSARQRGAGDTNLSYSLKFNDPDNRRNKLFFGASAGTPALVNLHLGFWGSSSLPFVAGVSGMYLSAEKRGAQVDLGWAFDNTGEFKQVIGIAGIAFSESKTETSQEKDQFGRVVSTTNETIHSLRPYVGPVYTADWRSFRLQAGFAFRAVPEAQSPLRAVISIGYTPPMGF